jgi:hypothetical protein
MDKLSRADLVGIYSITEYKSQLEADLSKRCYQCPKQDLD